jgi:hypothetical protein
MITPITLNEMQINLLRVLYNVGKKNSQELGKLCSLDNSTVAYQLCRVRDEGLVTADSAANRRGGFATWSITDAGGIWFRKYLNQTTRPISDAYVNPYTVEINRLQNRVAELIADTNKLNEVVRAERVLSTELNRRVETLIAANRGKDDYINKLQSANNKMQVTLDKQPHHFAVVARCVGSSITDVTRYATKHAASDCAIKQKEVGGTNVLVDLYAHVGNVVAIEKKVETVTIVHEIK